MFIKEKDLFKKLEHYFNEGALSGLRMALAVLKDPTANEEKIKRIELLEEIYDERKKE